jgi:hypothetical protein
MSMFGGFKSRNSMAEDKIAAAGVSVGNGMFWKRGTSYKSWKHRRWEVHDNQQLFYIDIQSSTNVVKGSVDISNVVIRDGPSDYTYQCGNPTPAQASKRISVTMESVVDNRELEIVFDLQDELVNFLVAVFTVSDTNNVIDYARQKKLSLPKIGAGLETISLQSTSTNSDIRSKSTTPAAQPPASKEGANIKKSDSPTSASGTSPPVAAASASIKNTASPVSPLSTSSGSTGSEQESNSAKQDVSSSPTSPATAATSSADVNKTAATASAAQSATQEDSAREEDTYSSILTQDSLEAFHPSDHPVDPFGSRTSISEVSCRGSFWKKGSSRLSGWRYRYYEISPDAECTYYDDAELTVARGLIDLKCVTLSDGSPSNIGYCTKGPKGSSQEPKVPINIDSESKTEGRRVMEVVFDSPSDFIAFIMAVTRVSQKHNVKVPLSLESPSMKICGVNSVLYRNLKLLTAFLHIQLALPMSRRGANPRRA